MSGEDAIPVRPPGARGWTFRFGGGARAAHPVTTAIVWSNIAVFLVQLFYYHALNLNPAFDDCFALSRQGLEAHRYWQFVTYAWLHSETLVVLGIVPIHILFNMLMVRFLGPELEAALGRGRFVTLYLASVVGAALVWLLWDGRQSADAAVLGASGAVFGLLAAYACYDPRRQLQVWIMFILPIRTTARTLVLVMVGLELFSQVTGFDPVARLMGMRDGAIGHSAHIGGALFGFLLMQLWRKRRPPADPDYFANYQAIPQDPPSTRPPSP